MTEELKLIFETAEKLGVKLKKEPKKNCKHCNGRGYIGKKWPSGSPICCSCMYEKEPASTTSLSIGDVPMKPRNRAEQREYMKQNLKRLQTLCALARKEQEKEKVAELEGKEAEGVCGEREVVPIAESAPHVDIPKGEDK